MLNTAVKAGAGAELTEALKEYVESKARPFERFVGDGEEALCEVELRKEAGIGGKGNVYYAEANLTVGGVLFRATAHKESFEAALDEVKDEMLRELRKRKGRKQFSIKEGGKRLKAWLRRGGAA